MSVTDFAIVFEAKAVRDAESEQMVAVKISPRVVERTLSTDSCLCTEALSTNKLLKGGHRGSQLLAPAQFPLGSTGMFSVQLGKDATRHAHACCTHMQLF